jgi:hypothetical protein
MNRHLSKYGNNTITRFDIVGSFFVNLFYNEFYKKSNSLKQQTLDKSTTDIYKELLVAYSDFTSREEFFKQAIKGIHAYVISNTNQIDMTHKECIDFIVKEFVPERIFVSLRDIQKSKLFHDTISNVVKQFISKILSKYIKAIVDYRSAQETSIILQNEFLDIICIEKDKVYGKFLAPKSNNNIPVEAYKEKLKKFIDIVSKKDAEIEKQNKLIISMKNIHEKSSEIIKRLQSKVNSMENYIKENDKKKINVHQALKQSFERKQSIQNSDVDSDHSDRSSRNSDVNSEKSSEIINFKEDIIESTNVSSSKNSNKETVKKESLQSVNNKNIIAYNTINDSNDSDKDGSSLLFDANDSYY